MTRAETIKAVEFLRRAYPRFIESSPLEPDIKKTAAGVVNLWAEMLADLPAEAVSAAVREYIRTNRYPPTVADIRALADAGPKLSAPDVYAELLTLFNAGISPDFPDLAYHRMTPACKAATMACGGWSAVGLAPEGDPHLRREFIRAAQTYIDEQRVRQITGQALPESTLPRLEGIENG